MHANPSSSQGHKYHCASIRIYIRFVPKFPGNAAIKCPSRNVQFIPLDPGSIEIESETKVQTIPKRKVWTCLFTVRTSQIPNREASRPTYWRDLGVEPSQETKVLKCVQALEPFAIPFEVVHNMSETVCNLCEAVHNHVESFFSDTLGSQDNAEGDGTRSYRHLSSSLKESRVYPKLSARIPAWRYTHFLKCLLSSLFPSGFVMSTVACTCP